MASYSGAPWTATNSNSGATTPTISKAAGAAGVQHVVDRCIISFATGATVSTALLVNLRDGATGAGTVVATWTVSSGLVTALSGVNSQTIDTGPSSLNFVGTAATAATLEFAAAMPANSAGAVTMFGHSIA